MINPNSQVETICAEFDWVGWGNKFCLQLKTKNKNLSTHSSFFQLQFKWKLKASTHCISRSSGSLALKVLCKRCEIEWSVLHCRTKIEVKWRYTNRYPQIKPRTGLKHSLEGEVRCCSWVSWGVRSGQLQAVTICFLRPDSHYITLAHSRGQAPPLLCSSAPGHGTAAWPGHNDTKLALMLLRTALTRHWIFQPIRLKTFTFYCSGPVAHSTTTGGNWLTRTI